MELKPKTNKKSTFCERVLSILGTRAMASSLESMCTLEISDLDCLINKEQVKEAIKGDYSDVKNFKVRVTSVNSRE